MSNKVKFDIEFPIQSSPAFLYQYLSTPDGLSEWFADNVNSRSDIYTFIWNGSEEKAKRISYRTNERIRYTDSFDDPNLPGEMSVTVTLRPVSCGTELEVVQEGIPDLIPTDQCYLGWQQSLALLALLVDAESSE